MSVQKMCDVEQFEFCTSQSNPNWLITAGIDFEELELNQLIDMLSIEHRILHDF